MKSKLSFPVLALLSMILPIACDDDGGPLDPPKSNMEVTFNIGEFRDTIEKLASVRALVDCTNDISFVSEPMTTVGLNNEVLIQFETEKNLPDRCEGRILAKESDVNRVRHLAFSQYDDYVDEDGFRYLKVIEASPTRVAIGIVELNLNPRYEIKSFDLRVYGDSMLKVAESAIFDRFSNLFRNVQVFQNGEQDNDIQVLDINSTYRISADLFDILGLVSVLEDLEPDVTTAQILKEFGLISVDLAQDVEILNREFDLKAETVLGNSFKMSSFAVSGDKIDDIRKVYEADIASQGAPNQIVIDGGGNDLLSLGEMEDSVCWGETISEECQTVIDAALEKNALLLNKMKNDGVEEVFWVGYFKPIKPGAITFEGDFYFRFDLEKCEKGGQQKLDSNFFYAPNKVQFPSCLRSEGLSSSVDYFNQKMKTICESTETPCHFIDPISSFTPNQHITAGEEGSFYFADGVHLSGKGSGVLADLISGSFCSVHKEQCR